jgi:hypothetical protein
MLFVERYCPKGIRPCPHEQPLGFTKVLEVIKQLAANSPPLPRGYYIGMPYQSYILDSLEAHDSNKLPLILPAKERHLLHFPVEFINRHVRFMVTIRRNSTSVGLGCLINYCIYAFNVLRLTLLDHDSNELAKPPTLPLLPLPQTPAHHQAEVTMQYP